MGALISYENLGDSATLTNSSDGTEVLTDSNVQVRQLGKVFRQTLATASPLESVKLDFDLGSAQDISYVGIFGLNIPAGTYAVHLGTTTGASDVATASGTLWQGVADDPQQQHVLMGATYSARYVRVILTPSAGQDVDVGRVWIDEPWTPKTAADFEHTVMDNSQSQQTIGQSKYAYERPRFRTSRITFNSLTEQEALGSSSDNTIKSAHHMDTTVGISSPLVCIPETTGADAEQMRHKLGFYGSITKSTPLKIIQAKDSSGGWKWRKQFTIEEEL